ncbi:hypothetical protein JFL43_02480 [Viridibacillus sp. YIM B01967]|uniref:Lipoprotein n=1 Tax=Viridibacillus soli TaxID=2798301 RepID=A0ABS1H2W0_9BACL|nr:hypothetical protein [Viridibacillus soli]MBK3493742.1 hypothetical protein [Viridibacillus soli]
MTIKKIIIFLVGFFLCLSGWQSVKSYQQRSIEKSYYNLGYKPVSDAIQDTESYYKTILDLPIKLPPLDFTHSFGRFDQGNENLEIEYLNEEKHFNYIINVFPSRIGNNLLSRTNHSKIISLKDGTQAYYSTIGIDKKISSILMF